ncbi:MAG TPA: hypothetical protein DHV67_04890, partial [Gallionella sp.]|nr:hypothetical protein [Gallionella sp.]
MKHTKRRIVPLALWERGDGGEGTGMACFIIRGGNMPCPLEALIKLFYSLLFAFFLIAHARAEALPPSVREALLKADVPESAVSIVVQEVNQTRPLLHLNEAWPMNPASTMK